MALIKHPSLYFTWLAAHDRKKLPPEWPRFIEFRTWAVKHEYKAEYGYDGEFTPDNLLAAIPGADSSADKLDAEYLKESLTLEKLKALAALLEVDIGKENTKLPIAKLIAATGITELPEGYGGAE